jgi:hypothetical protein
MSRNYVGDGFTWTESVSGYGPFDDFEVTFRPALPEQINEWTRKRAKARSGKEEAQVDAGFIAAHLVAWTLPDPPVEGNIRKLPNSHLMKLLNYTQGYDLSERAEAEKNSGSA